MEVELIDIDTNGEEISNIKSIPKKSDSSKKQNIGKTNKKCNIIIILSFIILLLIIILAVIKLKFKRNDLIDNNVEKNIGIIELTNKVNDKITIKKELLKDINSFIACLGQPGTGKSTFGSNYYKKLYRVKNDYFESSDSIETFTKGIWMISAEEEKFQNI